MDKFQMTFKILYLLSSVDNEISAPEIDIILEYIEDNRENIDFDHRLIVRSMLFLNKNECEYMLKNYARDYLDYSSPDERNKLLKFALRVVMADGKINEDEIRTFNLLGEIWGIDIDEFIKSTG